jgi:hypothetical protein
VAAGRVQFLLGQAEQVLVDRGRERWAGQLAAGERGDRLGQVGGEPGGFILRARIPGTGSGGSRPWSMPASPAASMAAKLK